MSIASEITRLQNAKADIKTAIEAKGVTVPSSAKLDDYDTYVSQISGGGGTNKLPQAINNTITSLTSDDFGNDTEIADYKFMGCTSLTSVTIPTTITKIGRLAFWYCTALTSITYQGTTTQWNAIEFGDLWSFYSGIATIHCTDSDITLITDYLNYNNFNISNYNFILNVPMYKYNASVTSTNAVYTNDGDSVWWNGEQLQLDNQLIDLKSNTITFKKITTSTANGPKSSKGLFEYNNNIYTILNGNSASSKTIWKYDAIASHASSNTDYWTQLVGAHQPLTGTNTTTIPLCRLGNDIYLSDNNTSTYNNLYKWVDETTGFDSTPITLSLPADEFRTWNIWTPDNGLHYFLSGSSKTNSSATISKKTYLWNDTNKTFDLWAENYSICFAGYTTVEYNGNIYCYGTNSNYGQGNKLYKIDIDYTNKAFTFTDVDDQFVRHINSTISDGFWDANGTRCLAYIMYRPRKTN